MFTYPCFNKPLRFGHQQCGCNYTRTHFQNLIIPDHLHIPSPSHLLHYQEFNQCFMSICHHETLANCILPLLTTHWYNDIMGIIIISIQNNNTSHFNSLQSSMLLAAAGCIYIPNIGSQVCTVLFCLFYVDYHKRNERRFFLMLSSPTVRLLAHSSHHSRCTCNKLTHGKSKDNC